MIHNKNNNNNQGAFLELLVAANNTRKTIQGKQCSGIQYKENNTLIQGVGGWGGVGVYKVSKKVLAFKV